MKLAVTKEAAKLKKEIAEMDLDGDGHLDQEEVATYILEHIDTELKNETPLASKENSLLSPGSMICKSR